MLAFTWSLSNKAVSSFTGVDDRIGSDRGRIHRSLGRGRISVKRARWLGPTLTCLAIAAVLMLAGSASARVHSSKVRNWPNTPLHHTLKSTLRGNNVPKLPLRRQHPL